MNETTVNAINSINSSNATQAEARATNLISRIRADVSAIAGADARITELRLGLAKINADQVTVESVFGGSLPETANKDTITKVVESMNKSRQFNVEERANRLASAIVAEQDAITGINKRLAELRKELAELTPEVVVAETIVG